MSCGAVRKILDPALGVADSFAGCARHSGSVAGFDRSNDTKVGVPLLGGNDGFDFYPAQAGVVTGKSYYRLVGTAIGSVAGMMMLFSSRSPRQFRKQ